MRASRRALDFPASVAPFILRSVTLAGIGSVDGGHGPLREQAWARPAHDLEPIASTRSRERSRWSEAVEAGRSIVEGVVCAGAP
ncbi:hypothetical protein ACTMU2_33900 [Cupriavidus basilensis]